MEQFRTDSCCSGLERNAIAAARKKGRRRSGLAVCGESKFLDLAPLATHGERTSPTHRVSLTGFTATAVSPELQESGIASLMGHPCYGRYYTDDVESAVQRS